MEQKKGDDKPLEFSTQSVDARSLNRSRIIGVVLAVIFTFLVAAVLLNQSKENETIETQKNTLEEEDKRSTNISLPNSYSDIKQDFRKELSKVSYSATGGINSYKKEKPRKDVEEKFRNAKIKYEVLGYRAQAPNFNIPSRKNTSPSFSIPKLNLGKSDEKDPNGQKEKISFLEEDKTKEYNSKHLITPISKYEVKAGTIIPAALYTGINSDLPGTIIAKTTSNVYDTTLNHLLIPQGSRLIGHYDSKVSPGQNRVLFKWFRIVFPNGDSIKLDNLPGASLSGQAGLDGEVDNHTWELIKGVVLATILNVGSNIDIGGGDSNDLAQLLAKGAGNNIQNASDKIVEKKLNRQPTIKVERGTAFNVIVTKDLVLREYNK